jgi:hypothetical protein
MGEPTHQGSMRGLFYLGLPQVVQTHHGCVSQFVMDMVQTQVTPLKWQLWIGSFYIFGILQPNQVGGLEHEFYEFPYVGNVIIQLTLIFFRGVETTNQIGYVYRLYGTRVFMCASMLKGIVCSSILTYSHHIFGRAGNYLVWGLERGSLRPQNPRGFRRSNRSYPSPIPGLSSNRNPQFQWC